MDDREKASEFVRLYDEVLAKPGGHARVHRVSHYLASVANDCLGADLRHYAAGGPMSDGLRAEVTAYQLCVLDDSVQESPHALVSRIATTSRRSGAQWWSSTVRLHQNRSVRMDIEAIAPGQFARFFRSWKIIGQLNWHRYRQFMNRRIATRPFLDMVYRTGHSSRVDWSLLSLQRAPRTHEPSNNMAPDKKAIEDVKLDFLKRAFPEGQMVTMPQQTAIAALDHIGLGTVPGHPHNMVSEPICIQVVSYSIAAKKFVETESQQRLRRMSIPAMVQKYNHWNLKEYPCDRLEVFTDGIPELIDLHKVIDWQLRKDIRHWSFGLSDAAGCWELTAPEVFTDKQWSSSQK